MNEARHEGRSGLMAVCTALLVISLGLVVTLTFPRLHAYLMPILFVGVPLGIQRTIPLTAKPRPILLGLGASTAVLLPYAGVEVVRVNAFSVPDLATIAGQLFVVSLPEEAFFRGFVQESIGSDGRAVVASSLLFALAHLPRAVAGDLLALLTFFPSLVMGWLYARTGTITPGVIFHFLANVVFLGFAGGR